MSIDDFLAKLEGVQAGGGGWVAPTRRIADVRQVGVVSYNRAGGLFLRVKEAM